MKFACDTAGSNISLFGKIVFLPSCKICFHALPHQSCCWWIVADELDRTMWAQVSHNAPPSLSPCFLPPNTFVFLSYTPASDRRCPSRHEGNQQNIKQHWSLQQWDGNNLQACEKQPRGGLWSSPKEKLKIHDSLSFRNSSRDVFPALFPWAMSALLCLSPNFH